MENEVEGRLQTEEAEAVPIVADPLTPAILWWTALWAAVLAAELCARCCPSMKPAIWRSPGRCSKAATGPAMSCRT